MLHGLSDCVARRPLVTADEPTAIRNPKRGKAHRPRHAWQAMWTVCGQQVYRMTERVPLSQTAPEDRCRTCWPTTKETR